MIFMLMNNVYVQTFNFIRARIPYLCPYHNVLPEGIGDCYLQTCSFVVIFMLMNNVFYVQTFDLVGINYDHIYMYQ